jgi:Universal stress protein family
VSWPISVATGSRSQGIAAEAARLGASLVLLGLRSHHALERALNDETTLNVMRASPCPMFGAPQLVVVVRRLEPYDRCRSLLALLLGGGDDRQVHCEGTTTTRLARHRDEAA